MAQEDDLRGLAKVMDFMRGIAILFVLIHILLVLLRGFAGVAPHLGGGQSNIDELPTHGWAFLVLAMDKTLCFRVSDALVYLH